MQDLPMFFSCGAPYAAIKKIIDFKQSNHLPKFEAFQPQYRWASSTNYLQRMLIKPRSACIGLCESRYCNVVVGGHVFEMGNRWEEEKGMGRKGGGCQYTANQGSE
jgi:hypothetical protein